MPKPEASAETNDEMAVGEKESSFCDVSSRENI